MAVFIKNVPDSFKTPSINTTMYVDGRKTYFTANMENVDGVLDIAHGGTGNYTFQNDQVVIYSNGKFITTGVTRKELETLSGIAPTTPGTGEGGEGGISTPPKTIPEILAEKVSTVSTADGTPLDMDEETGTVKLPDYLLKTGGIISGNLGVLGGFSVGNVEIVHDQNTGCIIFRPVE